MPHEEFLVRRDDPPPGRSLRALYDQFHVDADRTTGRPVLGATGGGTNIVVVAARATQVSYVPPTLCGTDSAISDRHFRAQGLQAEDEILGQVGVRAVPVLNLDSSREFATGLNPRHCSESSAFLLSLRAIPFATRFCVSRTDQSAKRSMSRHLGDREQLVHQRR
ncbi:MAG TPA: hypothetical protein VMO88_04410 [Acidimicrobiales bacterium]|nr:hypothetical protein [Acidimicrobiales bacterium]